MIKISVVGVVIIVMEGGDIYGGVRIIISIVFYGFLANSSVLLIRFVKIKRVIIKSSVLRIIGVWIKRTWANSSVISVIIIVIIFCWIVVSVIIKSGVIFIKSIRSINIEFNKRIM